MNIKNWEIAVLDKDRAAQIAETFSLPYFLAMLLDIRGFHSDGQVRELLSADMPLSDPYLMKGMDKAVARIRHAVEHFEKIAVYGDYDADGVTATSILFTYLDTVGADVMYYIPQREGEGYGMNIQAVETLHRSGVRLIITVDNGISSVQEVARAKELGMDVVITDHHRPHAQLPDAAAIVDPHQKDCPSPFKDLCGAGVVLKLLIALEDGDEDAVLAEYADLAALGTIGDVMPVQGENRTIIRAGLAVIANGGKPGVGALLRNSGITAEKEMTAKTLAYTVIPRINATGRMGAPERAVRLLTCDYEEEADILAGEICADNEERRKVEADITAEAINQIKQHPTMRYDRVLVVEGENWHHGVIGIVAARITDYFGKPSLVISIDGEYAKGSGRSVEGFSLFDAISSCGELFEKYGGHPMAAGVTLKSEKIEELRIKVNEYAKNVVVDMPAQKIKLDCKLNPASLDVRMPQDMAALEPFGTENPQPVFGLFNMEIERITPVGGGGHLRITCKRNGSSVTCMKFGTRAEDFPYGAGDKVDMAVTLDAKEFKGQTQLTVSICEIKTAGIDTAACIRAYRKYEKFKRQEPLTAMEAALLTPTRDDLAAVYRLIFANNGNKLSLQQVLCLLNVDSMNLGKLLVCFDILSERKLSACTVTGDFVTFSLSQTNGNKMNIYESVVFDEIRTRTSA